MTSKNESEQRGQLVDKGKYGWYGRYYITEMGKRRRVQRALHHDGKPIFNKTRAQWKLDQLIAENSGAKEDAERGETFRQAAERVGGDVNRMSRLRRLVYPLIGDSDPRTFTKATILDVLRSVRDLGKAKGTIRNVRGDISIVLQDLVDAEVIPANRARMKAKDIPEALSAPTRRSKKIRAVLTDDELGEYLGWEHPEERHRLAVRERQTMSCIARILGGLRTSDLHTIRWEFFDAPNFMVATVERQKRADREDGGGVQEFDIPAILRPHLVQWWQENGSPLTGLIFPLLRTLEAGKAGRKKSSHAFYFRRDLRRMWGIDQRVQVESVRSNGRKLTVYVWKPDVRPMTARETILLTEKHARYLPADFHSWRRGAAQAMKRGNVNVQTAMAVLDQNNARTQELYLRSVEKIVIPEASLPLALPARIGHTTLGTKREPSRTGENDDEEGPIKVREMVTRFAASGFYTPAVAGSIPVPPTNNPT